MNYQQILNKASNELNFKNLKSPKLDSELILAKTLNVSRIDCFIYLIYSVSSGMSCHDPAYLCTFPSLTANLSNCLHLFTLPKESVNV